MKGPFDLKARNFEHRLILKAQILPTRLVTPAGNYIGSTTVRRPHRPSLSFHVNELRTASQLDHGNGNPRSLQGVAITHYYRNILAPDRLFGVYGDERASQ